MESSIILIPLISSYSYATIQKLFFFHFFSNIKTSSLIVVDSFIFSFFLQGTHDDHHNMPSVLTGEMYSFLLTLLTSSIISENLSWINYNITIININSFIMLTNIIQLILLTNISNNLKIMYLHNLNINYNQIKYHEVKCIIIMSI